MGLLKNVVVANGIFAPFVSGLLLAGGVEIYYKSKVEGLDPHHVQVAWQDIDAAGKPIDGIQTQDFSGLGAADVYGEFYGKPLGMKDLEIGHWVIPPGHELPENNIVFHGKPFLEFKDEVYNRNGYFIALGCLLTGFAGTVGALYYAEKKGYTY